MRRFAAAFGLLGFLAATVTGALDPALPLSGVLGRGFAWGAALAVIGIAVGFAARSIAAEAAGAAAIDVAKEDAAAAEAKARSERLAARFRENSTNTVEDAAIVADKGEA